MQFSNDSLIREIIRNWYFSCNPRGCYGRIERVINLYGPKGCGKTKTAQDIVLSCAGAYYLCFDDLDNSSALSSFLHAYLPDNTGISDWEEAVDAFVKRLSGRSIIFFDGVQNEVYEQCLCCFRKHALLRTDLKLCLISEKKLESDSCHIMRYPTIRDYAKQLMGYSHADVLRLYVLTGGIPAIACEIDENAGYEENLKRLLHWDSRFSRYLPQWLSRYFRTPESYIPLLVSIANGRCRLSDIARDAGYPNNKCLTYLEALCEHGFVEAIKGANGKQTAYKLTNPYIASWCRFIPLNRMLQISAPDTFLGQVTSALDEAVALPYLKGACERYIAAANHSHLKYMSFEKFLKKETDITVSLRDGCGVTFDLDIKTNSREYFFVYPHNLEGHLTKTELERILLAVDQYATQYDPCVTVFTVNRISEWCAEKAAYNDSFYPVQLESLVY